jgi:hypothetical protein
MTHLQSAADQLTSWVNVPCQTRRAATVWGKRMIESANWLSRRSAKPPDAWVSASEHPAFRTQFDACDRLEEQVMRSISNPTGLYNNSDSALVKLAVSRALHTFDALLCLADAGYGAPALTLGRTLVEEAVASWWLRGISKDQMVKLLQSHEKSYALILQGPTSPSVSYLPLLCGLASMSAEDVDSARSQFDVDPNLGKRHWTRRTVQKMAASARDSMRSVERETLDALVGKPLLVANLMTHNSPLSMATRLVPVHDGEPVIGRQTSRRPSTALVHEALAVGYESLALIAWLVRDEEETTVVDDLIERGRYEFVVLRPDERPGRNDPCPCGSSKKFKQCHGAPGKREAIAPQEGRGWRP